MLKTKLFIVLIIAFNVTTTFAWNAAGHHLMAAITWDLMPTEEQVYWVDILEHHPRFNKDFKDHIPKYVKRNPETYNEWIFRQAARWADIPRGFQKKNNDKYHHGSWHYINFPIYLNKKINTKFLNLSSKYKGKLDNGLNIVQALKGNLSILSNAAATKEQKALALSWVLHLAGDAHQPLHSSALFSKNYFQKGDRGGNLTKIKGQGHFNNLHWYWDARLNTTTSFRNIEIKAEKLIDKLKKYGYKNRKNSIKQWLKNAHKTTNKYVYSKEMRIILNQNEKRGETQPEVYLSNEYDIQARAIAEKQIIKAAYQTAQLLSEILPKSRNRMTKPRF